MNRNDGGRKLKLDDKWTYEFRDDEEYRWCLNHNEHKRWYKKNKIDGEWEYYDVVGLIYHLRNPYDYCVQCGMKSVRISFSEISIRFRDLGIWQDSKVLREQYDIRRMKELGYDVDDMKKKGYDFTTGNVGDVIVPFLFECVDGCRIEDVHTDFYELKKDMVDERIKRGLSVDEIDTKARNNRKKEKELEQVGKENMKIWDKFF